MGAKTIGQVAATAGTALAVAKGVAALVNSEKKYYDYSALDNPDSSGSIHHLTSIAEGDDNNQRNGRSIKAVSLGIRGTLQLNAGAVDTCCRIILFKDYSSNGVAPTVTDVLQAADVNSFLNVNNVGKGGRFKILLDKFVCLSDSGNKKYHMDEFRKKLEDHIRFSGTTGAITSAAQGHYYMLNISDQIITTAPGFDVKTRVRFYDN